jgi:SAM-dependent methyltransferase
MLLEESQWIQSSIEKYFKQENFPLLNIGSSTGHFRKEVQPHIHKNIFLPLDEKGYEVIHLDMKMDEGVDIIGDLSDDGFRKTLKEKGIQSILCSNLLEHLDDPKPICNSIIDLVENKGIIIVTVPHFFPFHKDPIDTYFRPNIEELHTLFPGTTIVCSEIVASQNSYGNDMWKNKKFCMIMVARLILPFFRYSEWKYIVKDFSRLRKKYSATCLLLKKN